MISVVTPAYNRAHTLPRTYESLRHQIGDFEWIIVDDASTDDTVQIVKDWIASDSRIRLVQLTENLGVNGARMAGVGISSKSTVFFLDSDDELDEHGISTLSAAARNLNDSIGAIVFPTSTHNDESGLGSFDLESGQTLDEYEIVCLRKLEKELSYLYKREVFDFQSLPTHMRSCEFIFVYGLSRKYRFEVFNRVVVKINRQSDNLSSSRGVVKRAGEIGSGYLELVRQHRQVLLDCPKTKFLYLTKAVLRLRMAGLSSNAVFSEIGGLSMAQSTLLRLFSVLPLGFLMKLDERRLKVKNMHWFGRD